MKANIASIVLTSVFFGAFFSGRRGDAAPAPSSPPMGPPLPPPSPSNLPPLPGLDPNANIGSMPMPPAPAPSWPQPPRPPNLVTVRAGHRYRVTADVQAFDGVGLATAAQRMLKTMNLSDSDLVDHENRDRPGAGEVTRVVFDVTTLADGSYPIDALISVAGAGNIWVVSVVEVPR